MADNIGISIRLCCNLEHYTIQIYTKAQGIVHFDCYTIPYWWGIYISFSSL